MFIFTRIPRKTFMAPERFSKFITHLATVSTRAYWNGLKVQYHGIRADYHDEMSRRHGKKQMEACAVIIEESISKLTKDASEELIEEIMEDLNNK